MGERPARLTDTGGDSPVAALQPFLAPVPVICPAIESGTHPDVLAEIRRQGYEPELRLTEQADPYSYSSLIRELWRRGTGFLIVEQHALPPAGGLVEMQACDALVCNRPHNCRRDGVMGSLACVKFSARLCQEVPDFADAVLARRRPQEWWKAGLLVNRPYFPGAALPSGLRGACVDPVAAARFGPWPGPLWPTTQEWPHSDTVLFAELDRRGIPTHYHAEPSVCFPDPNEQRIE